ncbi:MAG: ketoacyl-ACP synthase III [Candidatus Margulisbacteria bacterium]|nr:ketoacyl-ACP synthase III [Candidatus Margulisiibacteriota bacterium]MBU1021881.1 ketoacyl-ACP synthase III [Candidatus Margulisiibacteriota bacterium]MBU1728519.1 ketoacyl-ACP synthase III [Candidatus Margulisiibacteriota bacterium]MBU1954666.1 ketoacyl-ACP synthase III [Candidatus Margulisiibacteriota bacterium]
MHAGIVGVGSKVPDKVLTNADLEKMVDTSDEWITARTGIKERRLTDYETATSDLAYEAAQKALEHAKVAPEEIDCIAIGTSSPDTLFPSVGCILQDKLGATNAAAFDVSAACSGFNYGLAVASALIESGQYKCVLLVGADTLTKYIDFKDRNTCILFGDGAGAVVLKPFIDGSGILANHLAAEGAGGKHLVMPGGGSRDPELRKSRYMSMDGKEVFKFAVRALETSVQKVLDKSGFKIEDVDLLIPHQANVRIINHALKKLRLPKEKVYVNLQKYGNTSAASVPIALDEALSEGRIKKGDVIVLSGFGAGLTYGANLIKWSV